MWSGCRVGVLPDAVARNDIDGLWCLGRSDQAAAFGFQLCSLGGLQGLQAQVAQAAIGIAVGASLGGHAGLLLTLGLTFCGNIGALGVLALFNVTAHSFDIALGLLPTGLGDRVVRAHAQRAAAAGARRIGNLGLAVGQAAFVDFGAGWLDQQAGKQGNEYPVHDVFIA